MSSSTFGFMFYGQELLVGTAVTLEPYMQGNVPEIHTNIDKLFQALHPFAVNGYPVRFLSEACVLKAPWAAYDLSHADRSFLNNQQLSTNNFTPLH
ncbi:hypothetical protein [Marinococcus halotolerans]|uniref:hypothetical protein n=1 Tax=Marinococcus halotolerans TaxID=301092 RepID=UPI0003B76DCD|nr:hypothetical protein [Marinococcus halotolerans]